MINFTKFDYAIISNRETIADFDSLGLAVQYAEFLLDTCHHNCVDIINNFTGEVVWSAECVTEIRTKIMYGIDTEAVNDTRYAMCPRCKGVDTVSIVGYRCSETGEKIPLFACECGCSFEEY